jgi:hypothetical protein
LALVLLGILVSTRVEAKLTCYAATFQSARVVACLQMSDQGEHSPLEERFDKSTAQLLESRYQEKDTVRSQGHFHQPARNAATCTVFEPDSDGGPDFTHPLFTLRAYWEVDGLRLPSHEAIDRALESPETLDVLDPGQAVELGEFAVSSEARMGLADLKTLSIAMELFDRFVFADRKDAVLTTRADGAWARLYRLLGFQRAGASFHHPLYPDWLSIAMRRSISGLRKTLQNIRADGALKIEPLQWNCEQALKASGG